MQALYDMSVRLSMSVTGFTGPAAAAMAMMQHMHTQAGLTGGQVDKLGKSLAMLGTGAAITGVGVDLLGFMDSAVKRAMALQTVMIGIQTRTGASTAQMAALQTQAQNIGLTNQMSVGDVAGVAQSASRAGITDIGQLSQMLKPLTNYAEVMLRATGADPSHSATIAVELAHLYGAFGNKQIGGVSDTQYLVGQLGRAMQIVPGSQDQFLRLLSQFVGTERPLYKGKPPQALISDTISEATLLSQMGQGQRGGNQIARIITAMMGGARGKSAIDAIAGIQRGTGIHFANAQGQINDPSLLLKALATTAQKLNPQQTMTEFSRAFQQNGARLAGLFSDPIVGTRLKAIADAMKAMPDLGAQQRRYNASVPGQFNQANKNFDSAMTQLGILWLPIAARAAMALASFTAGLVRFTQQNPALMQFIATFVAVTAAVSLVVGPLMMMG
nr:phage tail tape measure protein [Chloroflexota bacterium]